MSRYPFIFVLCVSVATPSAYSANLRLKVEGLSGELEKNVRVQLSNISTDEVAPDGRFQARVEKAIQQGLRPLGYYDPTVEFTYQEKTPPSRPVLTANVTPGEPIRVVEVNVDLEGSAKTDKDYAALIKKNMPKEGAILNHGEYEHFKGALNSLAVRKGYFDAVMKKSELEVSQEQHKSYWNFDFDSGDRYRFGPVRYHGSQICENYLNNLLPFKQGEYYTSDQLAEFSSRLANTGWFNSVVVVPDFKVGHTSEDKLLPLDASLVPSSANYVELGGGYATDVGPRVKAKWKKPWLNSRGHSLSTNINLSAPEQVIDASYKMPLKSNPLEQYYELQTGYKRKDINDTISDTATLNLSRNWDLSTGWQYGVNLRWSLSHFTQANVTNTTMLLYPGANVSRIRQRGGTMPYWGDSQRYSIDFSDTTWDSNVDFLVLQAHHVWIRTYKDKHRFVVRGDLGWIETNEFNKVPPDLRFFAGGDRSIRGYKYQKISPKNSEGKLTGASKLAVGSLEYQYNIYGNWWSALFVDAGEAVDDIKKSDFKTGAGVGVRWASPVGPIKFDLATPVGDASNHGIEFYIGLGAEL
ncbi:autotransporter assembly complex protein TamA [Xenorhabdus bovienii]|uniref:autotransporter assembly complex protein TamA n=1 Tax=Xenorhabdus bovienii TaxID=40576 RepID=UPI0023B280C9|nr:autotransporter assembly complex family protein [Xenorhabdus bovienii]MDE9481387.1 autotransporter assembly complex protein TamA [Xenorhabdus bovienii]MDE9553983.1 autotransporter assembly complex protein TamA [Xenorhabdus bovienii]